MRYVDVSNVDGNGRVLEPQELTFEKAPSRARRLVACGDTIISTVRTYLKAIAYLPDTDPEMVVSTGFAVLTPEPEMDSRFLAWAVRSDSFVGEIVARSVGVSYPAIAPTELGDIKLPVHPLPTQSKIADFLDRETAKIDALIDEKERLLKLLDERRQALITEAVTRGLDSSVPMKPSGLPWLGDIPAHWSVCSFKSTWSGCDYGISDSLKGEGSVRVLTMGAISKGVIRLPETGCLDEVPEHLLLANGDLLFNRTNSLAHVGKVGVFHGDGQGPVSFASYLVRLRVADGFSPGYWCQLCNIPEFLAYIRSLALPSINQANLNPNRFGEVPVPVPPIVEQGDITARLEEIGWQFSDALQAMAVGIVALNVRRSAVIHEAVTGQLQIGDPA